MEKEVFNLLINLYHEKKNAHAYLIETNDLDTCLNDLKNAIKKMIDKDDISILIDNNNLPSLVIVYPNGKEIKIEQIEDLKHRCSLVPLYTTDNFYIISDASLLNKKSFNSMLKFVEEPEDNIIGFFLCRNKDDVAQTIVSRCEILRIIYNNKNVFLNDKCMEIYDFIKSKNEDIICYNMTNILSNEYERSDYINFFKGLYDIYYQEFLNNKSKENFKRIQICEEYLRKISYNVNIELLLNSFMLEMGDTYE